MKKTYRNFHDDFRWRNVVVVVVVAKTSAVINHDDCSEFFSFFIFYIIFTEIEINIRKKLAIFKAKKYGNKKH